LDLTKANQSLSFRHSSRDSPFGSFSTLTSPPLRDYSGSLEISVLPEAFHRLENLHSAPPCLKPIQLPCRAGDKSSSHRARPHARMCNWITTACYRTRRTFEKASQRRRTVPWHLRAPWSSGVCYRKRVTFHYTYCFGTGLRIATKRPGGILTKVASLTEWLPAVCYGMKKDCP